MLLAVAAVVFALVPAGLALAGLVEPWAAGAGTVVALVLMMTGLHLIAGVAGLPCLGQAGFAALGALVTAQATVRLGLPAPLALLLGGAAVGLLGAAAAPLLCRLAALPFAGATLVLGALLALPVLHAPELLLLASGTDPGLPAYATGAALALVALLAAWRLTASEVGAALRAAGDDPGMAAATGIDAFRLRRHLFGLGVALAGLGGGVLAATAGAAAATNGILHPAASLPLLAAIVLGNPGRLLGVLLLGVPFALLAGLAASRDAAGVHLPLAGLAAAAGLLLWQRLPWAALGPAGDGADRREVGE